MTRPPVRFEPLQPCPGRDGQGGCSSLTEPGEVCRECRGEAVRANDPEGRPARGTKPPAYVKKRRWEAGS